MIKGVEPSFAEEEIMSVIQFLDNKDVEVAKVQRLKRRVNANGASFLENTSVIKIYFSSKNIQEKASIYGITRQVTEYIPRSMIC